MALDDLMKNVDMLHGRADMRIQIREILHDELVAAVSAQDAHGVAILDRVIRELNIIANVDRAQLDSILVTLAGGLSE